MTPDNEDLLATIAQLSDAERHTLMVELGRRYGLPAQAALDMPPEPATRDAVGALADYRIVFDGGSRGKPGPGYGSYVLTASGGGPMPLVRLELGERVTVHEAGYDTLIAALQDLLARIGAAGRKAENFTVEICGDNQLIISQVQGTWKSRDARLRSRCNVARQLLQSFRGHRLICWTRGEMERVLGR